MTSTNIPFIRNGYIKGLITAILLIILVACGGDSGNKNAIKPDQNVPLENDTQSGSPDEPMSTQDGDVGTGMPIFLSDGQSQPQQIEPLPVAEGIPLSQDDIEMILARLPKFITDQAEQVEFRLPEDILPPPKTGETIDETFPPQQEDLGEGLDFEGPLEVIRYSPEGSISIAPFINVTFNQPMVPVGTIEDLSNVDVPVLITPSLEGTWRWLGTKTINFQYDSEKIDRLPMATKYQVTIPAGTSSAVGGILSQAVEFSFNTPPPTMINYYPSQSPQPLDPIFFISFNQRIDPEEVLPTVQVTADGEEIDIKLASVEEIQSDKEIYRLQQNAEEERWLAFKTMELLPPAANVNVQIGPGTPSAEGPITTEHPQNFSFQTYSPLEIVRHGCQWGDNQCRPLVPFFIEFNNPIDSNVYKETMLKIDPELPGAVVNVLGNNLQIRGASQGQTTYTLTINKNIQDVFGQTLGEDVVLKFEVGKADPVLIGPDQVFVTLDPASDKPILSLYTINYTRLDLKIYSVNPTDWATFKKYLQEYQQTDKDLTPPGKLVLDEIRRLETPTNVLTEIKIDLSELMDGDYGHFIIIAKPPKGLFQEDRYWETVQVWVEATQIGLDAFVDHSEMVVWANALKNGSPLSGISIKSGGGKLLAETNEDGTSRFSIPAEGVAYLIAEKGNDSALLLPSTYYWGEDGWFRRSVNDELRWYVFDDRKMYRPGEEIHVKGWIRKIGKKQDGDVGLVGSDLEAISYRVIDPQGNDLGGDRISTNRVGGFNFSFTIPENTNLGFASIEITAEGMYGSLDGRIFGHGFQIQEFRTPEFEVSARNETTGPYFQGGSAITAVEAKYYAGGPLPNAETNWYVTASPSNYSPPNWPDFVFGIWQPWWWYYDENFGESTYEIFTGRTDATGNHYLNLDFGVSTQLRPFNIHAEATVIDVNRQAWSASTNLLVHPASLYVGLRSERYFVDLGSPLEIDLIVTDLDGIPVNDRPIEATAARLEWKFRNGRWEETEADTQECLIGSSSEPVACTFETPIGGRYRITAMVTDETGRQNKSQITRWVSGGKQPPSREIERESITLIPDKESYQPGDTAKILVQTPFAPAEGLLTVSRSGILYKERFTITDGSTTLEIPIETTHIPNLNLQVDLVGSAARTDDQGVEISELPPRPAYASGILDIEIPPLKHTLDLQLSPRDKNLEPGGETTLELQLKDSNGQAVSDAELAVVVVDEAILALSNYQLTDPVAVFYSSRPSNVNSYYSRANIILADPQAFLDAARSDQLRAATQKLVEEEMEAGFALEEPAAAPMEGAADSAQAGPEPIQVRTDFNPLATFVPDIRTDQNGKALVEIRLPDNLTRYRIMVVAVDQSGKQYGSEEANITARLPLMVRPSAPRFLNFGDSFEFPVVLQNQTENPIKAQVVIQTSNIILTELQGISVTVPANNRIEVRFPASTDFAGTARFQVAAVSDEYSDAAQGELPVYTPATTEGFATYGVIDSGTVVQPIGSPRNVYPQFGGIEIQTSSTALQALTDAVLYLVSYPYECSEQLASRILAVAALKDVLTAFKAEGLPTPEEMETAVNRDIERLEGLQNYDGGFPYWRRGWESIPFNSIHTAHALQIAKLKGFVVPAEMQQLVLSYLADIESHYPSWYSQKTRWTLSAYALYVRDLMGDADTAKTSRLLNDAGIDHLSLDALGWIWNVLQDNFEYESDLSAIRRYINNRVVETAGAANFTIQYDDQTYLLLSSNRRTDAILLESLILDNPESDLIPKLVNGLLAHRIKGRWNNTQENVFVLLALDRYFNTFESQTPDFVARIWLGETYTGEHEYLGRTTEWHETQIPMGYLVDPELGGGDVQDLIISKDGSGRLYYRLGLRYAPTDLWLDPLDMGFVIQREYESVEDPEDVHRDEDGIWHIKAGARIRVRLTMVADNRRYHVALVDPLPAGLEIVNPALAVSGSVPQDPANQDNRYGWWWYSTWYEHQNMRDERAEAFTPLLWDGVYEYTYVARATTPGKFVVPPAKAEEMYSPEVFGRSASDWVIVE
jgi:uncharacterized protein YfaS (alpha-2-macroglobulin family)